MVWPRGYQRGLCTRFGVIHRSSTTFQHGTKHRMDQGTLIFIFVSTLQAVIFGFTLLLIKRTKGPAPSAANYTVDAATKLAELEGTCTSLRLEFSEVVDRLERWSKREKQRDKRDVKPLGDVLPTDKDLMQTELPVNHPARGNLSPMDRLRLSKGR